MNESRRFIISGRVQGVSYRAWTVDTARLMGISGWVRNLRNGNVEALFHGNTHELDRIFELCKSGPTSARVAAIEVTASHEIPPEGFIAKPTV